MLVGRTISQEGAAALRIALCGEYTLPVAQGEAQVVCAPLPGRAVAAAARVDDVLWVVLDLDKPSAPRHARAMLDEWWALWLADEPAEDVAGPAPLRLVS